MPTPQQRRGGRGAQSHAAAHEAAGGGQQHQQQQAQQDGPQRALVAVTREIDNRLAIVQASATAGITADRLKLVALTVFTKTPSLLACEPVSIARAIVEAGQLGLEPTGLLGGAYLVPRGRQATLMIGYRGLVILAKRSGEVQRVEARVVRAKDVFEYGYGLEPYLRHQPSREADPGDLTYAYAVIVYRDGERQFDVMSRAEIEAIRGRSSAGQAGPWITDYFEMAKKTVLRRLLKLAPLTVNVASKLDELDPEVEESATHVAPSRQAELRQQLQQALDREYGPGSAAGPNEVEGEARALPTTQGSGGSVPAAAEAPKAEGAKAPRADGAANRQEEAAADSAPAAAPPAERPKSEPTSVAAVLGNPPGECGARDDQLDAGPCVLPKGHDQGPWHDPAGNEYPPQREHQEAGGTRFTVRQPGGNR